MLYSEGSRSQTYQTDLQPNHNLTLIQTNYLVVWTRGSLVDRVDALNLTTDATNRF